MCLWLSLSVNAYYILAINSRQSLWKAANYKEFEDKTLPEMLRMAGGKRYAMAFPKPSPVTAEQFEGKLARSLDSFKILLCNTHVI